MNNLNILLKQFKDWQLLLSLPAIQALLEQGWEVHVSESGNALPSVLQQLAPQIHWHKTAPEQGSHWLEIRPFELGQPMPAAAKTLFLPFIAEKELEAYERLNKEGLWLPLAAHSYLGYRTVDVPSLIDFVRYLTHPHPLQGKRVLVTGGPTAEDIDPVRFITNRSSGKMGLALARAAFICGAQVHFILGASQLPVPAYLHCLKVRSAEEMAQAVFHYFDQVDFYFGAAAVADFKPRRISRGKIKKNAKDQQLVLELSRTIDILAALNERKQKQKLIGFSVETENEIEHSRQKLLRKGLDCIIINNPKHQGAAFGQETNKITLLTRDGRLLDWPLMNKLELSLKIMSFVSELDEKA